MPDHAHIFVSVPPKWAPSDVAKILKGVSARRILKEFPGLRGGEGSGHLWTPSFYVGSAGNISAGVIERYIEEQRSVHVKTWDHPFRMDLRPRGWAGTHRRWSPWNSLPHSSTP
jgi:putative transposase